MKILLLVALKKIVNLKILLMLPDPLDITPVSVKFKGETIQESQSGHVRNLGVTFDSNLNWVKHIDNTVAKCCGILIGLVNAKNILPSSILPQLIESLVFSHLRYCVQVYGNASNCHLKKNTESDQLRGTHHIW